MIISEDVVTQWIFKYSDNRELNIELISPLIRECLIRNTTDAIAYQYRIMTWLDYDAGYLLKSNFISSRVAKNLNLVLF